MWRPSHRRINLVARGPLHGDLTVAINCSRRLGLNHSECSRLGLLTACQRWHAACTH